VEIEKMAKYMVIVLELEFLEALIKGFEHVHCRHCRGRERWPDLEDFELDVVGNGEEYVELDIAVLLYPCSSLFQ
jgi:hypothetical protein